MTIPNVSFNRIDPGTVRARTANLATLVVGAASTGVSNSVRVFSNQKNLVDTFGSGDGVEAARDILANGGAPVYFIRPTTSVAASNTLVSQTGTGPEITISGSALASYQLKVLITESGVLGTSKFKFSLDNGQTYSRERSTVAEFEIPNSGITMTLPTGSYVADEVYTATCSPAMYNSTDLTAVSAALQGANKNYNLILFAGYSADSTDAASLATAISTLLNNLNTYKKYRIGVVQGSAPGESASTIETAFAAFVDTDVAKAAGYVNVPLQGTQEGRAFWRAPLAHVYASRRTKLLISQSVIETNDPIPGVQANDDGSPDIEFDSFVDGPTLDDADFITTRTWVDRQGAYFTNAPMSSLTTSDYQDDTDSLIMNLAQEVSYSALVDYVGKQIRSNPDDIPNEGDKGTGLERDLKSLDAYVNDRLAETFLRPDNASGFSGHVQAIRFTADRDYNMRDTQGCEGDLEVVSLVTLKYFTVRVSYVPNLGA